MGQKYVHSNTFNEGDPISSSGWYCVYNGEKDSVIINGLFKNTTFTVQVVEYLLGANDAPQYYRCVSPTNDDWGIFSTSDFTYLPGLGFPDGSNAQWADFNNDGYLDFICKAYPLESTEFYVAFNNGDNTFTKNTNLGSNLYNVHFIEHIKYITFPSSPHNALGIPNGFHLRQRLYCTVVVAIGVLWMCLCS